MKSTNQLISAVLSGSSASHAVTALMDELPTPGELIDSIRNDLPKGTRIRVERQTVILSNSDRSSLNESIQFLSLVYPELEFITDKQLK